MSKKLRHGTQIFFFILIGLIAINHSLAESGNAIPFLSTASFHAICPFGGVEAFFAFINYGQMVQKLHSSVFVLLGLILFLSVLFGPVLCSYMCPLGSVQEWIGKLGKKIFGKKYNKFIPANVDKYLRYLRYVSLVFTVYLTTNSLKLIFLEVDPYYALFHFWSNEVTIGGLIVLGITLIASLFLERPWCKYACPFGALLGLTNFIRIFKVKRVPATCISCGKCDKACPMNINVSGTESVRNHQCISCGECTSENSCPVDDTVSMGRPKWIPIIIAATLILGISGANAFGWWQVESTKQPVKISSGEFEGMPDPEDIRGSYSFGDIEKAFDVPASVIARAYGFKTNDPSVIKAKDLENIYTDLPEDVEIGTGSIKVFVALYTGLPYSEPEFLPSTAIEVLQEAGKWNESLEKKFEGMIVALPESIGEVNVDANQGSTIEEHAEEEHEDEERVMKGKTTVADLIEWGVSLKTIEEVLGVEVPNENMTVRDICNKNGISFGEIKTALGALIPEE